MAIHGIETIGSSADINISPEQMYLLTDTVGTFAKLATLAALDQTPDEFVSARQLNQRIDILQNPAKSGWSFVHGTPTITYGYISKLFGHLGLIETRRRRDKQGDAESARITPLGSAYWPSAAGAYGVWQLAHPRISVSDMIGSSRQALHFGTSTRVRVMETLLKQQGMMANYQTIAVAGDIPYISVQHAVAELEQNNLLTSICRSDPETRNFLISSDLTAADLDLAKTGTELRQITLAVIAATQHHDRKDLDGRTMLKTVQLMLPDMPAQLIWRSCLNLIYRKHGAASRLITETTERNDSKAHRMVGIRPDATELIKDFLSRRNHLAREPEYRTEAGLIGRAIFAREPTVSRLLKIGYDDMPAKLSPSAWQHTMIELVPNDGLEFEVLFEKFKEKTGVKMTRKSFRSKLFEMDKFLDLTEVTHHTDIHSTLLISLKHQLYPADWQKDARCRDEQAEPRLFEIPDKGIKSKKEITAAKRFCKDCPVQLACLRTALESTAGLGVIMGGMTPEEIENISRRQKRKLQQIIRIESVRAPG